MLVFKVTVHSLITPSPPADTNTNVLSVASLRGDTWEVKGQMEPLPSLIKLFCTAVLTCMALTPSSSALRILAIVVFLKQSKRMMSPLDEPVMSNQPVGAKQQEVTLEREREREGWDRGNKKGHTMWTPAAVFIQSCDALKAAYVPHSHHGVITSRCQ